MLAGPLQPNPKKGRGCVIILAIVMGLFTLVVVGSAIVLGLFATSDAGKGTFKAISDGTKVAAKGLKAPGTPELRALGCEQAMVVPMKDFAPVLADLDAAGADAVPNELLVTCQVGAFGTIPTCDKVASTYVNAVGRADGDFYVTVTRQGSGHPECEQTYDANGAAIGLFDPSKKKPKR